MSRYARSSLSRPQLPLPAVLLGGAALVWILVAAFHYVSAPTPPQVTLNGLSLRILAVGDSITEGYGSSDGNGYRLSLLNKITQAGGKVEFIGSLHNGNMDNNAHEGYGGLNIQEIADQPAINKTLLSKPNVVLLHAGTNDMTDDTPVDPWDEAPERLGRFMDDILHHCPETVLIVAQIITCPWMEVAKRVPLYNARIPDIVASRASRGFKVTTIDMHAIGVDGQDLGDLLHPDDRGYVRMSNLWLEAIYKVNEQGWIDPLST